MNDIRLIASDVDGTILPRGGVISQRLRRAVERCRARGIPFIIASGRWIGALGEVREQSGAEGWPVIVANGAAVIGAGNIPLKEWLIDDFDTRRVYDILRGFDVQINAYLRNALYCLNTRALKRPSILLKNYIGGQGHKLVMDDKAAFESEALTHAYKLEALSEEPALVAAVKEALAHTGLTITHSSARNVEIMAAGVGKGEALKWLAASMSIPLEGCMAFGDNMNDGDLLSAVGWPVAMGNADPALKEQARIVAPADMEDGVAQVIEAYVFQDEKDQREV